MVHANLWGTGNPCSITKGCSHWLTREECEAYVESVWDWLEGLGTGISRSDPSTWTGPQWVHSFKGIVNSLEVAHQDFVWRIRKHPQLLQVHPMLPAYLSIRKHVPT